MSRPIRALTFRPSCALCRTHALSRMLPPPRSSISRAFSSVHPLAAAHSFSATSSAGKRPLKLAIIGAGPSGFYTASRVLGSLSPDSEEGRGMEVHMYERLPTPYGLVRYGVAPDHPEVKNCQHKFDDLAKDPRFRYFGNVLVTSQPSTPTSSSCTPTTCSTSTLPPGGSSSTQPSTALSPYTYPQALRLPLSSLTPHYNALLLSYGASLSNPLSSVPGSSSSSSPLRNVHPALALVGWYNGHPAFTDLPIDLRGISDVSIVGQGNVALDVARILLKHVDQLRGTDVPEHVLQVLAESDVRRVSAAGRRGPGQVAFTTKEFREMGQLPNVGFRGIDPALQVQAEGMVKGDRMRTRLLALMAKLAGQKGEKEFVLDFLKSPKAFIDRGDGSVGEVEWVHNELVRSGDGEGAGWNARETEERGTMRTDMVVESVGYRSEPLGPVGGDVWALPFDERRGRVVNVGGRVVGESGEHIQGVYAAGWVSRGPIGVIASTMQDAYTVADQMLSDHFSTHASHPRSASSASTSTPMAAQPKSGTPKAVEEGLRNGEVVDLERWGRIDAAERENGKGRGKEREKYVRVDDMLAV